MAETTRAVDARAPSVARMVLDRVAATPDGKAFLHPVGEPPGQAWRALTWAETGERVRAIAAGLLAAGLRPEEHVAIMAATRVEWVLADFGILCAGGATTTVYPSTHPEDAAYILADSGSRIAFVDSDAQLAKLRKHRDELPDLGLVVTFDGAPDGDWVIGLDELERRGREHLAAHPTAVDDATAAVGPDGLATLIYTSGTTGRPKGVRLVHDCWAYEGAAIDDVRLLAPGDVQYLWLPLSHSFGKVLLVAQLQVGFCSAVDGRVDRIVDNLAVVRPTFMVAVPRIFEKVRAGVVTMAEEEGGLRVRIFRWAFGVGDRVSTLRREGRRPAPMLAAQHKVADRLVFCRLQERFGGRLRYFVSGSAALSREIAEWFHAAGILILEGYGLTETSAATFMNRPDRFRLGTVGYPLPGAQVRLAEDGEICIRGPGVMRGYHNLPEQTAEAFDPEGWFRTGDVGEIDTEGFLRITDRKKELIKTSGGKYVAPQAIEVLFKGICPIAGQVVVHGDGRNYCTALVTLDPEALEQWAHGRGIDEDDYVALTRRDEVGAYVGERIADLNTRLNRWETTKNFRILDRDFSVEDGELTPSLKLRRKVVEARYRDLLDEMYAPVGAGAPRAAR